MTLDLPLIWALLIALAVFVYVVLDGADLGVGILFGFVHGKTERDIMVNCVAPVWDGNETWLVLGGGGLLAVFPLAYAILLPALYLPLMVMLLALVFRGVAFEMRFRARTPAGQLHWDRAFQWGSVVATLAQGIALGAFVQGVKSAGRAYAGGPWDWLSPFSLLTGVALTVGYGMLGACWLVIKTNDPLQSRFRRIAERLGAGLLVAIALVSVWMLYQSPPFRHRWLELPDAIGSTCVPLLVAVLAWRFFDGLRKGREVGPYLCATGMFALSYVGLGISMWPLMVPPALTIRDAAAPAASQGFLLAGAVVLVPMVLGYTAFAYWVFRGKVDAEGGYH